MRNATQAADGDTSTLRYHAVEATRLFDASGGNWLERLGRRWLRGPIESAREIIRAHEGYSWDLELLIEDEPYRRVPGTGAGDDISAETLTKVRRRCRQWYRHNPMAARWLNLTNDFVFGQGVSDPRAADPDIHRLIMGFWTNQQNRRVLTSFRAMRARNTDLQINGEVFLALFVNEHDGAVQVVDIDADEIHQIITHPENFRLPLWYRRKWARPTSFDFKTGIAKAQDTEYWYPDWQATKNELAAYGRPPGAQAAGVMHVALEASGTNPRGLPPLWRGLDWLKVHRGFLEDRATLTKARATLAWLMTQKGATPKRLGEVAKWLQTDQYGRKIPPATGSILRKHESVQIEPVETPRDASNAADEARLFEHMISAASGWPEPYFGDVSRGGRITSTSLDLPVALRTEAYRQLWTQVFDDLFQFVIDKALERQQIPDKSGGDDRRARGREAADDEALVTMPIRTWRFVDFDFPPLAISQGVAQLIAAISDAADRGMFEEIEAAKVIMQLCGVDDAAYKIRQLAAQKAERTAVAVQIAQGRGAQIPIDDRARREFPKGERVGVRSPDRKVGAPATRGIGGGAEADDEALPTWADLPAWEWAAAEEEGDDPNGPQAVA